ncbi:allantoate amidohydrolase [Paenibacillus tepidiphilus]|uniref:allantoate amidohydrolase n=1 Tax=Paenibacillus tepidiphilus TaxID=2608683 RepID=UPI001238F5B6|nr:allantoate amidohydrolase [Paenibacillus tepidiphilus]
MKDYRIKPERLLLELEELGKIGRGPGGGLDRTAFTPAELAAREWLKERLRAIGLDIRVDAAANIWGTLAGTEPELPAIAMGSHLDTVPSGGRYDGALGVLTALEVVRTLAEQGVPVRHPLQVVSFSAEEPNPFGLSTFGSRAAAGKLKPEDLAGASDGNGLTLGEALRRSGGDLARLTEAVLAPGTLSAYLEVHIEQGLRLLRRDIPVGIVTAVTGIYREEVAVYGEANHAGTTLMEDRRDALAAAAELMLALETACRSHPAAETVGTVGMIANSPNAANIVPGRVVFHLEIRGKTRAEIQEVLDDWKNQASHIVQRRHCKLGRRLLLDQHPVPLDRELTGCLLDAADGLGIRSFLLGSMAGHDAAHMAAVTRSGMLFVPSLGGKSHCPEEQSRDGDIVQAANVLLRGVLALDRELDRQAGTGTG